MARHGFMRTAVATERLSQGKASSAHASLLPFLLGSGAAVSVLCKPAPLSPRISAGCVVRPRKAKMVMWYALLCMIALWKFPLAEGPKAQTVFVHRIS
eukprot:1989435-Prorocentrum_lima.AAC.1